MGSKLKRIKGCEFQQIHNIVLFAGPHNQQFFKSYFIKSITFPTKNLMTMYTDLTACLVILVIFIHGNIVKGKYASNYQILHVFVYVLPHLTFFSLIEHPVFA